jgi:hypothetical protein
MLISGSGASGVTLRKRKSIPIPVEPVFFLEGWVMKISCIQQAILIESVRMM